MIVLLTVFATLIIGLGTYYYWQMSYWKRQGVIEPDGKSMLFGHFYTIFDKEHPISMKLSEWTKRYGKTYGLYEGLRKVLVTSDLKVLNEVFVKQFESFHGRKTNPLAGNPDKNPRTNLFAARGIRWKRLRTITSPSFSNASLRKINGIVEDSAIELIKHLEKKINSEINIREYFQELTLDIILRLTMGQSTSHIFNNPFIVPIVKSFEFDFRSTISMLGHCSLIPIVLLRIAFLATAKFSSSSSQSKLFIEILGKITRAVDERIKQREEDQKRGIEPGEPNDFIDLFLDARADDLQDSKEEFERNKIAVSKNLTYEEIKGQLMVFLLAGFDTTANALSYTAYLLAKNPQVLMKLHQEIDNVCTEPTIDFDTLGRLKYLEAVFKETLRMYPMAASVNSRQCMKSTRIGDLHIEQGTFVLADTWSIHYDKQLWGEDADRFVPERWLKDSPHSPGAYLPFGAGSRVCVGMRLAFMEAKLTFCHILRKFDIVEGPNTDDLNLQGSAIVHPEHVNVVIKSRD